jgi:hypothetical protein
MIALSLSESKDTFELVQQRVSVSSSRLYRRVNLRIVRIGPVTAQGGNIAATRDPSSRRTSSNGCISEISSPQARAMFLIATVRLRVSRSSMGFRNGTMRSQLGETDPIGDERALALSRQARLIPIVATRSISSLRSALTGDESCRTLLQCFRTKLSSSPRVPAPVWSGKALHQARAWASVGPPAAGSAGAGARKPAAGGDRRRSRGPRAGSEAARNGIVNQHVA